MKSYNIQNNLFLKGICLLAALTIVRPAFLQAQSVDKGVVEAVIGENWSKAVKKLKSVDEKTSSPVLRLLKGHACLAENRNNESLCLFLSVASDNDRNEWYEWTDNLISEYPNEVIAQYLRGDALARLAQWDEALGSFSNALVFHGNHPLILNARGVVYAAKREWNRALNDFYEAANANSSFADVYASRGTMYIQKNSGAKGALEAFNHALEVSPEFVLALNGRGGIRIVTNEWDEAESDFKAATKLLTDCLIDIRGPILQNMTVMAYEKSEAATKAINRMAKVEPGMSINKRVQNLSALSPQDIALLKTSLQQAIKWNRKYSSFAPDKTTFDMGAHVNLTSKISTVGAKMGVTGTWNEYQRTTSNMKYQQQNLDILNKMHPDVKPAKMGPLGGFITNQKMWNMTHSAADGVTTEGVDDLHVDKGNWKVATVYGLAYNIE